jgi:hypothetical protein
LLKDGLVARLAMLMLSQHAMPFDTSQGSLSRGQRLEARHRLDQTLNASMILLNAIVEITRRALLDPDPFRPSPATQVKPNEFEPEILGIQGP